jgi:Tol biopolymer transport system component
VAGGAAPRLIVESGAPRSPWILPDGKHLLYYNRKDLKVHVVGLDGAGDTAVVEATTAAIYANGQLLFMREDTLLSQPFDLSSRTVSALLSPSPAACRSCSAIPAACSPHQRRGFYSFRMPQLVQPRPSRGSTATVNGNRSSVKSAPARGVVLSPDNQSAIVGMLDAEAHLSLWRVTLANNQRSRLVSETPGTDVSAFPTWAPDGRTIAYAAKQDGKIVINRLAADGGRPEALFEVPAEQTEGMVPRVTAWTKDATTLMYAGEVKGGHLETVTQACSTGCPVEVDALRHGWRQRAERSDLSG